MFLLRGWTLLPPNDNWLENSLDWFHWPNKERVQYLRNFLFSVERSKKSSEIRLFFAANDFVFFQLLIFKSFFQKQQSVGNTIVFLWTSSQKLVANMIAAWKTKSYQLWQKSKAFSFPSKAKTVRDKKTSCHEYIKNRKKKLFEASVAFSQPKSFIST